MCDDSVLLPPNLFFRVYEPQSKSRIVASNSREASYRQYMLLAISEELRRGKVKQGPPDGQGLCSFWFCQSLVVSIDRSTDVSIETLRYTFIGNCSIIYNIDRTYSSPQ